MTGRAGEHGHVVEYSLKLDSNPEFTGSVLAACARAVHRLSAEGQTGCKTLFDVPPAYLSPLKMCIRDRHSAVYSEPVKIAAVVKQFIKKQAEDYRRTRELPGSAGFIASSFMTPGFDVETGEVFRDAWDAGKCV